MAPPARVVRVAAVQAAPAFLDLPASLDRLEEWARRAAQEGARLIAFGETWLTGYPAWLDESPEAALWGHPGAKPVFQRPARCVRVSCASRQAVIPHGTRGHVTA